MKKFISALCLLLCMIFMLSACTKDWKVNYDGGEVKYLGGSATVVGDYVYFINGIEDSTADNTFPNVVKGSLCRIKLNDFAQDVLPNAEVVVPLLFSSSFYDTGICIFDDFVYYGTTNTTKDKTGSVLNGYINFQKTKLDGTQTSEPVVKIEDLSVEYKFIKSGNIVYLVTINTTTEDDVETTTLTVYNMSTGKSVYTREMDGAVLPDSYSADYIFFTDLVKEDDGETDKQYGAIYSYKLGDEKEEVFIDGSGLFNNGTSSSSSSSTSSSSSDKNVSTLGYTFNLIKIANNQLYYSYTFVDTSTDTNSHYVMIDVDLKVAENLGAGEKLGTIIANTSIFLSKDNIIYFNSDYGIVSYNYNKRTNEYNGETVVVNKTVTGDTVTLQSIYNGYIYYLNSDNFLYRVSMEEDISLNVAKQITSLTCSSEWYPSKVFTVKVGLEEIDYVLTTITDDLFGSYQFCLEADVEAMLIRENALTITDPEYDTKLKDLVEEYFEDMSNKTEKGIKSLMDRMCGKQKDSDKTSFDEYMSSNFPESSSSSVTSSKTRIIKSSSSSSSDSSIESNSSSISESISSVSESISSSEISSASSSESTSSSEASPS